MEENNKIKGRDLSIGLKTPNYDIMTREKRCFSNLGLADKARKLAQVHIAVSIDLFKLAFV